MNTLLIVVVVILTSIILFLLLFKRINRPLVGGGATYSAHVNNRAGFTIIFLGHALDDYKKLKEAAVERDYSYITSLSDMQMVEEKCWLPQYFCIVTDKELENPPKNVPIFYITSGKIDHELTGETTIIEVDSKIEKPQQWIFGELNPYHVKVKTVEEIMRVLDPVIDFTHPWYWDIFQIYRMTDILKANISDFAKTTKLVFNSDDMTCMGVGGFNTIYKIKDVPGVLRVSFRGHSEDAVVKANTPGFVNVIRNGNGWQQVEELHEITLPVNREKMMNLYNNLVRYFSNCPDNESLVDLCARNLMMTGDGEYVVSDIDLFIYESLGINLDEKYEIDYTEEVHLDWCSESIMVALAIWKTKKSTNPTPRQLTLVMLDMWKFGNFRDRFFLTPEFVNSLVIAE